MSDFICWVMLLWHAIFSLSLSLFFGSCFFGMPSFHLSLFFFDNIVRQCLRSTRFIWT